MFAELWTEWKGERNESFFCEAKNVNDNVSISTFESNFFVRICRINHDNSTATTLFCIF